MSRKEKGKGMKRIKSSERLFFKKKHRHKDKGGDDPVAPSSGPSLSKSLHHTSTPSSPATSYTGFSRSATSSSSPGLPNSLARKVVFGAPLGSSLKSNQTVPLVVTETIQFILKNKGHLEEGLFRVSGNHSDMLNLRRSYDSNIPVDWSQIKDVHLAAGLLKLYLRELPEPLLTAELKPEFAAALTVTDAVQQFSWLTDTLSRLPDVNKNVIFEIFALISLVAENQAVNKMTEKNLAIVFVTALSFPNGQLFHLFHTEFDVFFPDRESFVSKHFAPSPVVTEIPKAAPVKNLEIFPAAEKNPLASTEEDTQLPAVDSSLFPEVADMLGMFADLHDGDVLIPDVLMDVNDEPGSESPLNRHAAPRIEHFDGFGRPLTKSHSLQAAKEGSRAVNSAVASPPRSGRRVTASSFGNRVAPTSPRGRSITSGSTEGGGQSETWNWGASQTPAPSSPRLIAGARSFPPETPSLRNRKAASDVSLPEINSVSPVSDNDSEWSETHHSPFASPPSRDPTPPPPSRNVTPPPSRVRSLAAPPLPIIFPRLDSSPSPSHPANDPQPSTLPPLQPPGRPAPPPQRPPPPPRDEPCELPQPSSTDDESTPFPDELFDMLDAQLGMMSSVTSSSSEEEPTVDSADATLVDDGGSSPVNSEDAAEDESITAPPSSFFDELESGSESVPDALELNDERDESVDTEVLPLASQMLENLPVSELLGGDGWATSSHIEVLETSLDGESEDDGWGIQLPDAEDFGMSEYA